jgi:WD40 repeat protein
MKEKRLVACLSIAAMLSAGTKSSLGACPAVEVGQGEANVRTLEHQRAPLPDASPIGFKSLLTLQGNHARGFGVLAFSPDGTMLAATRYRAGEENPDVAIWHVQKNNLLHVVQCGDDGVDSMFTGIAFVPPGDRLVGGRVSVGKIGRAHV